jgi:rRNA maturation protein Nop10
VLITCPTCGGYIETSAPLKLSLLGKRNKATKKIEKKGETIKRDWLRDRKKERMKD